MKLRPKVANVMLFRERIRANRHLEMRKALFLTKLRKHPTPHKDVTLSKRGIEMQWLQTRLRLRARRSFAEGAKRMEQNRDLR